MSTVEAVPVEVPDIGDFEDIPVIEIHVSEGDRVSADDPLLTLESDKATMDVPAPFSGVVRELRVGVGDRVSQGTLLVTIEPAAVQVTMFRWDGERGRFNASDTFAFARGTDTRTAAAAVSR